MTDEHTEDPADKDPIVRALKQAISEQMTELAEMKEAEERRSG